MNDFIRRRTLFSIAFISLAACWACSSNEPKGNGEYDPVSEGAYEIHLTGMDNGRIFQRNSDGRHDVHLSGTVFPASAVIEARVVNADTMTEIVPWSSIGKGAEEDSFEGVLSGVPQGGWYKVQFRFDGNESSVQTRDEAFAVGVLIACTGQSQIDFWFDPDYQGDPPDAHELTAMYRHGQFLQGGPQWQGWQNVTGMGARVFASRLADVLGVPVGLLDYGVNGSSLLQKVSLDAEMGWWLEDGSHVDPDSNNYAFFTDGLISVGKTVEALLWIQGHTDAMQGVSKEEYENGLSQLFSAIREDTQVVDLPIFMSLLPRQAYTSTENVEAIREAVRQYSENESNAYIGATTADLPLCEDQIHYSPQGQRILAERLAQGVLHVIVGEDSFSYHRGATIESALVVDSQTIDVHIRHEGGGDFQPGTEIDGFTVHGAQELSVLKAERKDANTIRLEISGDTGSATRVDYLYGANPGELDLEEYAASYVHDDSPLSLPLEGGTAQLSQ